MCGSKKKIHAHHIKKWASNPSERFSILNGISLCHICHKQVTGHEEHFVQFFTDIITRNILDKLKKND